VVKRSFLYRNTHTHRAVPQFPAQVSRLMRSLNEPGPHSAAAAAAVAGAALKSRRWVLCGVESE
jgi:hypothetical protein